MSCVRDIVISSEFFNISSYIRSISCLNGYLTILVWVKHTHPLNAC